MYTVVSSTAQLAHYNRIWSEVWKEKGFELEVENEVMDKLLVSNEHDEFIGTFEVKPYQPDKVELREVATFHLQPELISSIEKVAEVDKVALLPEHRGNNISRLLSAMVYYADRHLLDYYVCLLEPVFARALRISFKVPMRKIGGRTPYKGDDVVPTIIDVGRIRRNKHEYPWVLPTTQEALLESSV